MQIRQVTDLRGLEAYHAVTSAAHEHDYVALPADPLSELLPHLDPQPDASDRTVLFLSEEEGVVRGVLSLSYPMLDNLTCVNLSLCVHPRHRRLGVASALMGHGIAAGTAEGRTRFFMEVPSQPGQEPQAAHLMASIGARPVLDDYRRILDLRRRPPAVPPAAPAGYRFVQWTDHCPDELLVGVAYLMGRMTTDAPLGDMDYEPEKWDAARVRQSERDAASRDRMRLATAVIHEPTGDVAGFTDIAVNRSQRQIAYQWDTIVDPRHRGRELGMGLKTRNHTYLVQQNPEVELISTWNAISNAHMVAVNVALGFEIAEQWTEYQLDV